MVPWKPQASDQLSGAAWTAAAPAVTIAKPTTSSGSSRSATERCWEQLDALQPGVCYSSQGTRVCRQQHQ